MPIHRQVGKLLELFNVWVVTGPLDEWAMAMYERCRLGRQTQNDAAGLLRRKIRDLKHSSEKEIYGSGRGISVSQGTIVNALCSNAASRCSFWRIHPVRKGQWHRKLTHSTATA